MFHMHQIIENPVSTFACKNAEVPIYVVSDDKILEPLLLFSLLANDAGNPKGAHLVVSSGSV